MITIGKAGRVTATVLIALAVVAAGTWGSLALWFRAPPGWPALAGASAWGLLCLVVLTQLFTHRRPRAILAFAASFVVLMLWWDSLLPSNDRDWAPDVARVAVPRVDGDTLVVENVRAFTWRGATEAEQTADERWETRRYPLASLTGADLFLSYWAGEAIAHAIVSFQFRDAPPLAFSIEIRREKGEAYSPIAGFFKSYEVAFIAADESDVVKVRATVRQEDVRIYRLAIRQATARRLLDSYVAEAQDVASRPRWYHTITTNCTTAIFRMVRTFDPTASLDWRVIASGYLPAYLYDADLIDRSHPLEAVVAASHIGPRAPGPDIDPGFPARIRVGVPTPVLTPP